MKRLLISFCLVSCLTLSACETKKEKPVVKEEVNRTDYYRDYQGYRIYINGLENNLLEYKMTIDDPDNINHFVMNDLKKADEPGLVFEEVIKSVNTRHEKYLKEVVAKAHESVDELYGSDSYREINTKGKLTESEYNHMQKPGISPDIITKIEAMEDVKFLEKYFRSYYGPYKVFGKENFKKANSTLTDYVNSQGEEINVRRFGNEIYEAYGFIRDLHGRMGDKFIKTRDSIKYRTDGYLYDDYYFLKDDKGYYLKDYEPKTYLESIEGYDIDEVMHYGITDSGELAYVIGIYDLESKGEASLNIKLAEKDFVITLKQMAGAYPKDIIESFDLKNGYPVYWTTDYNDLPSRDFKRLENIARMLKEEVFINDVRRNHGGGEFVKLFSGLSGLDVYDLFYHPQFDNHSYGRYQKVCYEIVKKIPHQNLLISLSDANAGSGGDLAIHYALLMDNSLVIGEPTAGYNISGTGVPCYLPNSKYYLNFAPRVDAFVIDRYIPDGIGLSPDIWTTSIESLDRAVLMLEHYGIKPGSKANEALEKYGKNENPFVVDFDNILLEKKNMLTKLDYYNHKLEIKFKDNKFCLASKYFPVSKGKVIEELIGEYQEIKEGTYKIGDYQVDVVRK